MNIPFFYLNRQNSRLQKELETKFSDILQHGDFIEGRYVKELEQKMEEYLGTKHVITCANGTESLVLALIAVGVKRGDEVITTPFSFIATSEAIATVGAVPVFADIDEHTLNIDPCDIEEKITAKTKAILPVHIFGKVADMDAINVIANKYGLKVIEDACQAIGASYKGKMAGTLGDVAGFSFYPTKNLGACGDGGMITTDSDEIASICRAYKSHGAGKLGALAESLLNGTELEEIKNNEASDRLYDPFKYYNFVVGGNSRLDSLQAAVLLTKLPHLGEYNARRCEIAEKYCNEFKELSLKIPEYSEEDCWHQYAVRLEGKDDFITYMAEHGVGTGAFYPVPLHLQKAFKSLGYTEGDLPVVEKVCKQSVCLPIFPELTDLEVDYIVNTVKAYF